MYYIMFLYDHDKKSNLIILGYEKYMILMKLFILLLFFL